MASAVTAPTGSGMAQQLRGTIHTAPRPALGPPPRGIRRGDRPGVGHQRTAQHHARSRLRRPARRAPRARAAARRAGPAARARAARGGGRCAPSTARPSSTPARSGLPPRPGPEAGRDERDADRVGGDERRQGEHGLAATRAASAACRGRRRGGEVDRRRHEDRGQHRPEGEVPAGSGRATLPAGTRPPTSDMTAPVSTGWSTVGRATARGQVAAQTGIEVADRGTAPAGPRSSRARTGRCRSSRRRGSGRAGRTPSADHRRGEHQQRRDRGEPGARPRRGVAAGGRRARRPTAQAAGAARVTPVTSTRARAWPRPPPLQRPSPRAGRRVG